jgi:hypothetical protein
MFGLFRKTKAMPYQSYAATTLRLDFGVKDLTGEIAARSLGDALTTYVGYKMAVERCLDALGNADIEPSESGKWQRQQLREYEKTAVQMKTTVSEQLELVRTDAANLSEPAVLEVALELGLILSTEIEAEPTEEANVTEQLLADAEDPKAKAKQERLAEKQQKKAVGQEANAFLTAQKPRAEALNSKVDITSKQAQTKTLNEALAPQLEAQAKVVVEVVTTLPTQETDAAYRQYQQDLLLKELNKQSSATPTEQRSDEDLTTSFSG